MTLPSEKSAILASPERDKLGYFHWSEKCPQCGHWHKYQSRDLYAYVAGCTYPTWCGQCFATQLRHRNKE